jgi:hypothetical protein
LLLRGDGRTAGDRFQHLLIIEDAGVAGQAGLEFFGERAGGVGFGRIGLHQRVDALYVCVGRAAGQPCIFARILLTQFDRLLAGLRLSFSASAVLPWLCKRSASASGATNSCGAQLCNLTEVAAKLAPEWLQFWQDTP